MCKLRGKEVKIIKMYKEGIKIAEIAKKYGVIDTTIQRLLHRMKVPVKRGDYKPRISKYNMKNRTFSPEFLANRKINTEMNNHRIKHIKTVNDIRDQRLIRNILNKAFM